MSGTNQTANVIADDNGLSRTGQIAASAVFLTMLLTIVILILYLRCKGHTGAPAASSRYSHRLVFASNTHTMPSNALDRSILDSIPITGYRSEGDGEGLECAICICKLSGGERIRFLPKCQHVFHVECIDMWFGSNSTCPLCRIPVRRYTDDESSVTIQILSNQEGGTSSSSSSCRRRNFQM